jgi:transposase
MRTAGSPQALEKRRLEAINLFKSGMAQAGIARKLRVHDRTVRRWIATFRRKGRGGVKAKPVPGRPRKFRRISR